MGVPGSSERPESVGGCGKEGRFSGPAPIDGGGTVGGRDGEANGRSGGNRLLGAAGAVGSFNGPGSLLGSACKLLADSLEAASGSSAGGTEAGGVGVSWISSERLGALAELPLESCGNASNTAAVVVEDDGDFAFCGMELAPCTSS